MTRTTTETRLIALLLLGIALLVVLPMLFLGTGMVGPGPMMDGTWGDGTWGHGMWGTGAMTGWMLVVGLLMPLLFVAALVLFGALVYRASTDGGSGSDPALAELRLAYARGELTDEEYDRRREALETDGRPRPHDR